MNCRPYIFNGGGREQYNVGQGYHGSRKNWFVKPQYISDLYLYVNVAYRITINMGRWKRRTGNWRTGKCRTNNTECQKVENGGPSDFTPNLVPYFLVLQFSTFWPSEISGPAFSGPAFPNYRSFLVLLFPVPHFQSTHHYMEQINSSYTLITITIHPSFCSHLLFQATITVPSKASVHIMVL